ncbi:hypothetical protein ACR6C2_18710 [Streptomyces sp. INA 01156]
MDLLLEPSVHPVEVFLFGSDLPVANGIVNRIDRGFLLSLSGHRAPF